MLPTPRWALRLWFGCLAFFGVVSAHGLTFFMAAPHGHDRRGLLELTGHGSWSTVQVMAGLAIAAAVAFSLRMFVRSPQPARSRWSDYRTAVVRLFVAQAVGYLGVEVFERLNVGASLADVATDRLILAGILAQAFVAAFACLVLFLLARVVGRLFAGKSECFGRAAATPGFSSRKDSIGIDLSSVPWSLRGPPALARL